MLNIFAKILLVSTALSPVLGAVAINQHMNGEPWTHWSIYLIIGLLLILLCYWLLKYAAKKVQKHIVSTEKLDRRDHEMLAFLFIYMLPFLRTETLVSDWLMVVYILVVVILAIASTDAFHFNPAMRVLGYRFYAIKNRKGITQLLISNKDLRHSGGEVQAVQLSQDVYLYVEDQDA